MNSKPTRGDPTRSEVAASRPPVSVLVVEDNPDHAALVMAILQAQLDCFIDVAGTVAEGFQKATTRHYDLLMLDYSLPDGDGLEILDWIKKDCVVIIMTSNGNERVAVEAMKGGAFDYVVKDTLFRASLPVAIERALDRVAHGGLSLAAADQTG
jgi:DNA-binding response OmpR family regulator